MTHRVPILIPIENRSPSRAFVLFDLPVVIGRGWEAEIRVDGPSVDAKHCVIYREGDDVRVKDLQTWAGTCVNGERIHQQSLQVGDRLEVAGFTFLISALGAQTVLSLPSIPNEPLDCTVEHELLAV